jgi:hypothetical protein
MTFELSKELHGFQYEVEAITKRDNLKVVSIRYQCAKCKKFKKKNTNSIYCFKCLGF